MNFVNFTGTAKGHFPTPNYGIIGNVLYVAAPWTAQKNAVLRWICHRHLSQKANKLFWLPFRSIWSSTYLKSPFPADEPLCFLITSHYYWIENLGGLDYIRKHFKNSKIVMTFPDKYELYKTRCKDFPSPEALKKSYDMVITYNTLDAEKYGFTKTPVFARDFSEEYANVPVDTSIPESDVMFVGQSKGRLDAIHDIYRRCKEAGLRCDFHIVGVEPKDMLDVSDIEYNRYMVYEEVVRRVKRTNCVLNYVYEGNGGATMRDYEAVGNNKLLLTNNLTIKDTLLYDREQVLWIDEIEARADEIRRGKITPNRFAGVESQDDLFLWLSRAL